MGQTESDMETRSQSPTPTPTPTSTPSQGSFDLFNDMEFELFPSFRQNHHFPNVNFPQFLLKKRKFTMDEFLANTFVIFSNSRLTLHFYISKFISVDNLLD